MSARRTQAVILPRRDRRTRLQPNRVVQYSTDHGDCVDFMQIQPDSQEEGQSSAWLAGFSWQDKVILVLIKMLDSLLSLYVAGLLIYVIQLAWGELGPGLEVSALSSSETNKTSEEERDVEWLQSNVTVLGLTRWTMTFSHFSLIFSLIHAVYGIMAVICDMAFFHTLLTNKIKERYIATILPVHRLFFLVISSFDGLVFLFSHHIVSLLGDVFPVILVTLIGVIIIVDTGVILLSYGATTGQSGIIFSRPWRNLVILATIVLMTVYSLVRQYNHYTWDIIPILVFSITSSLIIVKCLLDNVQIKYREPPVHTAGTVHNILNFLMCVSSCNVLGLFSVSTISHQLMFNYYRPILDFL